MIKIIKGNVFLFLWPQGAFEKQISVLESQLKILYYQAIKNYRKEKSPINAVITPGWMKKIIKGNSQEPVSSSDPSAIATPNQAAPSPETRQRAAATPPIPEFKRTLADQADASPLERMPGHAILSHFSKVDAPPLSSGRSRSNAEAPKPHEETKNSKPKPS